MEVVRQNSFLLRKVLAENTCDTLGILALEAAKKKSVDYEHNRLNRRGQQTALRNKVFTCACDARSSRTAWPSGEISRPFM